MYSVSQVFNQNFEVFLNFDFLNLKNYAKKVESVLLLE
jgi:hypothetical protein